MFSIVRRKNIFINCQLKLILSCVTLYESSLIDENFIHSTYIMQLVQLLINKIVHARCASIWIQHIRKVKGPSFVKLSCIIYFIRFLIDCIIKYYISIILWPNNTVNVYDASE